MADLHYPCLFNVKPQRQNAAFILLRASRRSSLSFLSGIHSQTSLESVFPLPAALRCTHGQMPCSSLLFNGPCNLTNSITPPTQHYHRPCLVQSATRASCSHPCLHRAASKTIAVYLQHHSSPHLLSPFLQRFGRLATRQTSTPTDKVAW